MAENNLKAPLLQGEDQSLMRTSSTQLFKSLSNVETSLGVKDDFNKATSYLRDLRPVMIETPFKGSSLVMTQDEKFFVFGSREGRLGIASRDSKQVVLDKDLNQGSIWSLTLINNDKYILSAGATGNVKKFLYSDLSDVDEFSGHTDEINFIQISPDEKFMYTCADDTTVREWSLTEPVGNHESKILYQHSRVVYSIDLSLDATYIASGSADRTVKVYSFDQKNVVATLEGPTGAVWCVKISAFKNFVVCGDQSAEIHVWNFGTWDLRTKLLGHTQRVRYMDMAKDESFLVTAGLDHTIKIWDMHRPRQEITLTGHTDWVKFALVSKNMNTIFSISDDSKVAAWRVPMFDNQMNFTHTDSFNRLDSPNEHVLARNDSGIQTYSLSTGKKLKEISLADYEVIYYTYSKLGDKIFVVATDNTGIKKLLTWDLSTGNLLSALDIPLEDVRSALVFPNESILAIGQDIKVFLYRMSDMAALHTFRSHKGHVTSLAASPDNTRLFSVESSDVMKYYTYTTEWKEVGGLDVGETVKFMQVTPCGEYLFVVTYNELFVWTVRRMEKVYTINDFTPSKILFSSDTRTFFYNSSDHIHLRDIRTFMIITSQKLSQSIEDFTVSKDESLIITTTGTSSTIFSNPLKATSVTIYGDWQRTYDFIDYANNVMQNKAKHDPQYDTWMIAPFHINAVHLYANYNQPGLMQQAIASHSPFYKTRTGHTPLEISLEKKFMDCVDSIYQESRVRLEGGDRWAFYYFGDSLISLNYSGYDNLHKIYEQAMRKASDPTLPKFCDETVALPVEVNSESPVMDSNNFDTSLFLEEGTAVVFAQSAFRISLNVGSQDSTDLLESIIKCPNENIYGTKVIQMILRGKWKSVRWFLGLQAIFYFVYLVLLSVYSSQYIDTDPSFLIWPFAVSCLLFVYEIVQMVYDGLEYLEDSWNYIDLFRSFLLFFYSFSVWADYLDFVKECLVLLVLFSWLRGISYFRLFGKTRYLIKLIIATTIDISAFFIILFYSTVAFALIYQAMLKDGTFMDNFLNSFKLNLGDLGDTENVHGPISWCLFLIVSIINPVIMLNLLISIMGDTYGRVKEGQIVADARQLAEMILEVEGVIGWRRGLNEKFYIKMVCEESELNNEDNSVEGKLDSLTERVKMMIDGWNSTKEEIFRAIRTSKDTVLGSI